jgi:hypothetical protein
LEIYREVVLRTTTPAWLTDGGELCLASAARVRSVALHAAPEAD